AIFRALALLPFGVLLATMGVQRLWSASIVRPLRPFYQPVSGVALACDTVYAAWAVTKLRLKPPSENHRRSVRESSLPAGMGTWLVGDLVDRAKQWRIVAVCLLALMPIQFRNFWSDYFSDYRVRSSVWLG